MEFGKKKYGVLVLKRKTGVSSEGVEISHIKRINEVEAKAYKYLDFLEHSKFMESDMKQNFQK